MPLNAAALVSRAPVEHDGLRFRSRVETRLYDALKSRPVLFFPNAVLDSFAGGTFTLVFSATAGKQIKYVPLLLVGNGIV